MCKCPGSGSRVGVQGQGPGSGSGVGVRGLGPGVWAVLGVLEGGLEVGAQRAHKLLVLLYLVKGTRKGNQEQSFFL